MQTQLSEGLVTSTTSPWYDDDTHILPRQRLGMLLTSPATLAFHGVANTNDHIG